MKLNSTAIAEVLDRSGSMSTIAGKTRDGHNEFLRSQKAVPGECHYLLTQFDHEHDTVYDGPIADAPELTAETYLPRGSTALLDAIGDTITRLGLKLQGMHEEDRPEKVVFVILTDGEENASRRYTRARINEMITHQRTAYNWQFVFLGANQDAIQVGAEMGIPMQGSVNFAVSNARNTYGMTSAKVASLRSSGVHGASAMSATMSFSEPERAELERETPSASLDQIDQLLKEAEEAKK